jgi:XTP/dITP diphosphohydrolase
MKLLIATRNRHKLDEIRAILGAGVGLELVGADEIPGLPEVVEDGDTFAANAARKASALARASGLWSLADDSGLEVDALGGAPGVISARYAGEPADPAANNRKLLRALDGVADRRARFRCAIALAEPGGAVRTVEGRCEGSIAHAPRGAGGFGYDPLFVPEGGRETFAEMDPARKNAISHRGRALAAAAAAWTGLLARAGERYRSG